MLPPGVVRSSAKLQQACEGRGAEPTPNANIKRPRLHEVPLTHDKSTPASYTHNSEEILGDLFNNPTDQSVVLYDQSDVLDDPKDDTLGMFDQAYLEDIFCDWSSVEEGNEDVGVQKTNSSQLNSQAPSDQGTNQDRSVQQANSNQHYNLKKQAGCFSVEDNRQNIEQSRMFRLVLTVISLVFFFFLFAGLKCCL